MTINLFQTPEYRELMNTHISQTIEYLFEKNSEFSLACEIKHCLFNPELPANIQESFDDVVLFVLSGYTFETSRLDEEAFTFEAGFGEDNVGSVVSVPLLAIQQMFIGSTSIVINHAKPMYEFENKEKNVVKSTSKNNSMEALLNNPENKKFKK
jgi:hypothetical protein